MLFLLPLLVSFSTAFVITGDKQTQVSPICLLTKCTWSLLQCQFDAQCRQAIQCMQTCQPNDQHCSSDCFFKYANEAFNGMVKCGLDHKCMPTMTWSDRKCPVDEGLEIKSQVQEFPVEWFAERQDLFVLRGSDPIFDCYPCQRLTFETNGQQQVRTHWTTQISNMTRGAYYNLTQMSSNSIQTSYSLFGMPVEERYYILEWVNDYVLYFYCGKGFGGEYQGALVYGKDLEMDPVTAELFHRALRLSGVEDYTKPLNEFCKVDYSNCQPFETF